MGDQMNVSVMTKGNNNGENSSTGRSLVIDIYPLSCYYFGSKDPLPFRHETLADRVQRMKSKFPFVPFLSSPFSFPGDFILAEFDDAHGLRTCVEAVLLVELFKHPHLLVLQVRNSIFKLPGGRIRPGESDVDGLKRKLSRKLSANEDESGWEVGECLGMWWRAEFETLLYPYLAPNVKLPKECIKLYLVKLPASQNFMVPKSLKLLAVPLCQIHGNHKTYGPVISAVPQLLSKFTFNTVNI